MSRSFRNTLKITFFLSCLGVLIYWGIGTIYYGVMLSHAPLAPDPAHGLVVPYDNHGTIHYFTAGQIAFRHWATVFAFVCHGLLIGSAAIGLIFTKPQPEPSGE
jgi:hypothetical protein